MPIGLSGIAAAIGRGQPNTSTPTAATVERSRNCRRFIDPPRRLHEGGRMDELSLVIRANVVRSGFNSDDR